ncbi:MAG: hypothetical protein HY867_00545 [Chloroflexi bacterium]|nr:hypothetical protein [Chloroflexota bacterium]
MPPKKKVLTESEKASKTRQTKSTSDDSTLPILLAELNIIAARTEHADQIAESRLNILLTSATGAGAILILLDQLGVSPNNLLEVSAIVFLVLWMLGLLTFIRMLERNIITIHSNRSMSRIRKYFVKNQPELSAYINLPKEETLRNPHDHKPALIRFWGSRTLAAVVSSAAIGLLIGTVIGLFSNQIIAQSINAALSFGFGLVHLVGLEWYAINQLKRL